MFSQHIGNWSCESFDVKFDLSPLDPSRSNWGKPSSKALKFAFLLVLEVRHAQSTYNKLCPANLFIMSNVNRLQRT